MDRVLAFICGWLIGDFSTVLLIAFFMGAFRNDEK